MASTATAETSKTTISRGGWHPWVQPSAARILLLGLCAAAGVAGLLAVGADETHVIATAGPDFVRLLRAMAVLKAVIAGAAVAAVLWRLGAAVTLSWFAGYALACGAMAAGPGLIWGMAHVGLGALLLHAGLLAAVLLLWRDPTVGVRLAAIVASRRAALRLR